MKRHPAMKILPPVLRSTVDLATAIIDYQRVAANARVELARHRFCCFIEEKTGATCMLDADHKPPHRARVGERIDTPRGPRRQIIEWR